MQKPEKRQEILDRYIKLFRDAGDSQSAYELHARNMMEMIRFFKNIIETNKSIIELMDLIEDNVELDNENNLILVELRDRLNDATITFERSLKGRIGFIWEDDPDPPGEDQ